LGPSGGAAVEGKLSEGLRQLEEEEDSKPVLSQKHSDLELLRSHNVEEVTEELLTFHEVVYHMQEQEEDLIDTHHQLIEQQKKWMDEDRQLIKMTGDVDYDVEAYAGQLESLLATKLDAINKLKNLVSNFRQELHEEEMLSKNIKVNKKQGSVNK
jgi:kinesin family protein 2/24